MVKLIYFRKFIDTSLILIRMAVILKDDNQGVFKFHSGGTLISNKHVLTGYIFKN